jgi:thiol:disulfide interchange protein DsbC
LKKIASITLLSSILASSLFAVALNDKEIKEFKKMDLFNKKEVVLLGGEKISNDFALIKGYVETNDENNPYSAINIITNKEVIIPTSDAFNLKTKQSYNVDIDYSKFEKYSAYKFGTGKEKLILFTDGECPACKQTHPYYEGLKDRYTVYVYLFPLNMIHLVAKDIALATLSQPLEKREEFYNRMLKTTDIITALPELENYGVELYKNIKQRISLLENPRNQETTQRYIEKIKKAYNKDFKSKQELVDFCDEKINKFNDLKGNTKEYKEIIETFKENEFLALAYLGVDGTPYLFDYKGQKRDLRQLLNK